MSLGIQTQVNAQQAPAVAGDWASGNPRAFVDAGQGALVTGANGAVVGRFVWLSKSSLDNDNAPAVVNNTGTGPVAGIIHRGQQGLITTFLADSSMSLIPGTQTAVCSAGDLWVKNDGATAALVGQKAYANYADGKVSFAATGAPGTASATGSIAAGAGANATGTINNNIFTAVSALTGTFVNGGVLTGTNVATGTRIVNQVLPLLAGEALGGLGRYVVSIPGQTVASTVITESWGVFTAASVLVGAFGVGDTLSGSGVTAGTTIVGLGTGTGGLGTYIVDLTQTAGSTTITAGITVETRWVAMSAGNVGELVKISTHLQG